MDNDRNKLSPIRDKDTYIEDDNHYIAIHHNKAQSSSLN